LGDLVPFCEEIEQRFSVLELAEALNVVLSRASEPLAGECVGLVLRNIGLWRFVVVRACLLGLSAPA